MSTATPRMIGTQSQSDIAVKIVPLLFPRATSSASQRGLPETIRTRRGRFTADATDLERDRTTTMRRRAEANSNCSGHLTLVQRPFLVENSIEIRKKSISAGEHPEPPARNVLGYPGRNGGLIRTSVSRGLAGARTEIVKRRIGHFTIFRRYATRGSGIKNFRKGSRSHITPTARSSWPLGRISGV